MSLSRKLQQRKAAVLSDSLEKLHVLLTAKIPWVARAVFQILATDRATGGTESPVDFPTPASEGVGVIARPGRIVGYLEVIQQWAVGDG